MGNLCNNHVLRSGFVQVSPDTWYVHEEKFSKILTNYLYLRLYLVYVLDAKFIKFTDYYYSHATFNIRGCILNIFVHLYDSYSFFFGRRFLRRVFYQTYRWTMFRNVKRLRKLLIFKNKKVLRFFGFMRFLGMCFFYLPGLYSTGHVNSSHILDGYFFKKYTWFLWLNRFFSKIIGKKHLKMLRDKVRVVRRKSKSKLSDDAYGYRRYGYFPRIGWLKIKYFHTRRSAIKRVFKHFKRVYGRKTLRTNDRFYLKFRSYLGKSFENLNPIFAILTFFSSYISAGFVNKDSYFKNRMYTWKEKLKKKLYFLKKTHSKNIRRKRKVTKSLFQFFFGIKNYLVLYKSFFNYQDKNTGNKFLSIAKFYGLNDYINRFNNLKSRYYKKTAANSDGFVENTVSFDLDGDSLFFSKSRIRSDFYLSWFQQNKGYVAKNRLLDMRRRLRKGFYNTIVALNQFIYNRSNAFKRMLGRKVILRDNRKMLLLRLNKELKNIKKNSKMQTFSKVLDYLLHSPLQLRYGKFIDFSKVSLFFLKQALVPKINAKVNDRVSKRYLTYFNKFFLTKYNNLYDRFGVFFDNYVAYFDKFTGIRVENTFIPKKWTREDIAYTYYLRKFNLQEDLRRFYKEAVRERPFIVKPDEELVKIAGFYSPESNAMQYDDLDSLYKRYWRFLFGVSDVWDVRKGPVDGFKNSSLEESLDLYAAFSKKLDDPIVAQLVVELTTPYKFFLNKFRFVDEKVLSENLKNIILDKTTANFKKWIKSTFRTKAKKDSVVSLAALVEIGIREDAFFYDTKALLKRIRVMRKNIAFSSENLFLLSSRLVFGYDFRWYLKKLPKTKAEKANIVKKTRKNYRIERRALNSYWLNNYFNTHSFWNKGQIGSDRGVNEPYMANAKPTAYEILSFMSLLENILVARFSTLLNNNFKQYKLSALKRYVREKILLSLSEYLWTFTSRIIFKKELAFLLLNKNVSEFKEVIDLFKSANNSEGNYRFLYKLNRILSSLEYKDILLYFFKKLDGQIEHLIMYMKKRFNIYTELEQYKLLGKKMMGYNFRTKYINFNKFFLIYYKYRVSTYMYKNYLRYISSFSNKWLKLKSYLFETLFNANSMEWVVKRLLYVKIGGVFKLNRFRRKRLKNFASYFAYIYLLRFFKKLYGLTYSKIYKKRYINLITSNIYKFKADRRYFEVFRYTIGKFLSYLTRFPVRMSFFLQENDSNKSSFIAKMVSKMMLRGTSYRNLIKPLRLDFKSRMKKNVLGKYSDVIQDFTQFKSVRSIYKYLLYYRVRDISSIFSSFNNVYINSIIKYRAFALGSLLNFVNDYKQYYLALVLSNVVIQRSKMSTFVMSSSGIIKPVFVQNSRNILLFNYFFWLHSHLFFNNLENFAYTNKLNDFTSVSKRDTFAYFFDKIRHYDYWMNGRFIHGYKFHFSGRFKSKQRASSIWFKEGKMTLSTVGANIDYGFFMHTTWFGRSNLKIWLYKTELFPTHLLQML